MAGAKRKIRQNAFKDVLPPDIAWMEGRCLSLPRIMISCLLIILTGGFFLLIQRWSIRLYVMAWFSPSPLNVATHLYVATCTSVITNSKSAQTKHPIESYSLLKVSGYQSIIPSSPEPSYTSSFSYLHHPFILHRGDRCIWDPEKEIFKWTNYLLNSVPLISLPFDSDDNFTILPSSSFNAIHTIRGLSCKEAQKRLDRFGPNSIEIYQPKLFELVLNEILSPLILFQIASVILWCFENYHSYALTIFFITALSIFFSIRTTLASGASLARMAKQGIPSSVMVLRIGDDGIQRPLVLDPSYLVPGDLLVLPSQQDYTPIPLPCDGILLKGDALIDESFLTGESVPVTKTPIDAHGHSSNLQDISEFSSVHPTRPQCPNEHFAHNYQMLNTHPSDQKKKILLSTNQDPQPRPSNISDTRSETEKTYPIQVSNSLGQVVHKDVFSEYPKVISQKNLQENTTSKINLLKDSSSNRSVDRPAMIYGGTLLLEATSGALVRVTATGPLALRGRMLKTMRYPPLSSSFAQLHADALAFMGLMAVLALVGFLGTLFFLKSQSLLPLLVRAGDLVTVVFPPALPASLALGTGFALRRLAKNGGVICTRGVLPNSSSASSDAIGNPINVAGRVDCVLFDKTGTLTEESLEILFVSETRHSSHTPGVRLVQHLGTGNSRSNGNSAQCTAPIRSALATCHTLRLLNGKLVGDPLDVSLFKWTGWNMSYNARGLANVVVSSPLELPIAGQNSPFTVSNDTQSSSINDPDNSRPQTQSPSTNLQGSNVTLAVVRSWPFCPVLRRTTVLVRRIISTSIENAYTTSNEDATDNNCTSISPSDSPTKRATTPITQKQKSSIAKNHIPILCLSEKPTIFQTRPIDKNFLSDQSNPHSENDTPINPYYLNENIYSHISPDDNRLPTAPHGDMIHLVTPFPGLNSISNQINLPIKSTLATGSASSTSSHTQQMQLYVKGAPESLLPLCDSTSVPEAFLERTLPAWTRRGYRVLLVAGSLLSNITWVQAQRMTRTEAEEGTDHSLRKLKFLGAVVLVNPLKQGSFHTIARLSRAGIMVGMATGDHAITAAAIARQVGIVDSHHHHITINDLSSAKILNTNDRSSILSSPLDIKDIENDQSNSQDKITPIAILVSSPCHSQKCSELAESIHHNPQITSTSMVRWVDERNEPILFNNPTSTDFGILSNEPDFPSKTNTIFPPPSGYLLVISGGDALRAYLASLEQFGQLSNAPTDYLQPEKKSFYYQDNLTNNESTTHRPTILSSGVKSGGIDHLCTESQQFPIHKPPSPLGLVRVFARLSPDDKRLLVESVSAAGHVTAFCGDGANDVAALQAADVGIALATPNSDSLISSFCSTGADPKCVLDILIQGRASLAVSFACFRFMALYSMIQFAAVSLLYAWGQNLSDGQFIWQDLALILPMATAIARIKEGHSGLCPGRLPSRLLHPTILVGMFLQILLQVLLLLGLYFVTVHTLGVPLPSPLADSDNLSAFEGSPLNTCIFLFSNFQYIVVGLVFGSTQPFQEPIYANVTALFLSILLFGANLFWVLIGGQNPILSYLFGIVEISPLFCVGVILGFVVLDVALSVLLDCIVCPWILSLLSNRKQRSIPLSHIVTKS